MQSTGLRSVKNLQRGPMPQSAGNKIILRHAPLLPFLLALFSLNATAQQWNWATKEVAPAMRTSATP